MAAVEKYYSVGETALLLSVSERTIRRRIKDRAFGDEVVNIGDKHADYRIPASSINAYLQRRRIFTEPEPGIAARTVAELKRKSRAV